MKIILAGGGTGGHFYPLIAVAQKINKIVAEQKLLKPKLYYLADNPYDKKLLFENEIIFKKISAGKLRRYFSVLNFFGVFKTGWGFIKAFFLVFNIFPEAVGRLPIEKDKIAVLGNPVREELVHPLSEGAAEFLGLSKEIPTILVLGGSSGAQIINENLVDILPELVENYQIIHQTGKKLFEETRNRAGVVLEKSEHKNRYKVFAYLNTLALRLSAGQADLVISRAGAGSISEIAVWELPSIIIPIPESVSGDQKSNAFAFARAGAAVEIEQDNLTANLFLSQINKLMRDEDGRKKMGENARKFARAGAAEKIAAEIINIALEHAD